MLGAHRCSQPRAGGRTAGSPEGVTPGEGDAERPFHPGLVPPALFFRGGEQRGERAGRRPQRTEVARDAGTKLPATLWVPSSRGPGWDLGASGRCGGLGARPGISGRHRASPCVPGHRGRPRPPSAASLLPGAVRRPLQPSGLRGTGSPGSPRPTPGLPALRPPLTPETWRSGPGRRRSGARGSGDGGRGLGRRGRGRRTSRSPAVTFLLPGPEEGPGGAAASQVR